MSSNRQSAIRQTRASRAKLCGLKTRLSSRELRDRTCCKSLGELSVFLRTKTAPRIYGKRESSPGVLSFSPFWQGLASIQPTLQKSLVRNRSIGVREEPPWSLSDPEISSQNSLTLWLTAPVELTGRSLSDPDRERHRTLFSARAARTTPGWNSRELEAGPPACNVVAARSRR
jgi:hypothetical protein